MVNECGIPWIINKEYAARVCETCARYIAPPPPTPAAEKKGADALSAAEAAMLSARLSKGSCACDKCNRAFFCSKDCKEKVGFHCPHTRFSASVVPLHEAVGVGESTPEVITEFLC